MNIDELTQANRLRILNALDTIRETSFAIGGAVLTAARGVRELCESDAVKLAEIIGQCEQNWKLAQSIAHELNKLKDSTMLVISRKEGEEFTIGDSIKVTVLSIFKNRVALCIKAPDDVLILRAELVQAEGDDQLMGGLDGGGMYERSRR